MNRRLAQRFYEELDDRFRKSPSDSLEEVINQFRHECPTLFCKSRNSLGLEQVFKIAAFRRKNLCVPDPRQQTFNF